MNKKSGITMSALVVYIVLLFAFTAIALTVSSRISTGLFADKGAAINAEDLQKAIYCLNNSAVSSTSYTLAENTITFSNGDMYTYISEDSSLTVNKRAISRNVTGFTVTQIETGLLKISMTYTKYTHSMERDIYLYVGE